MVEEIRGSYGRCQEHVGICEGDGDNGPRAHYLGPLITCLLGAGRLQSWIRR